MTIPSQQGEREQALRELSKKRRASGEWGEHADVVLWADVRLAFDPALAPLVLEQIHSSVHQTARSGKSPEAAGEDWRSRYVTALAEIVRLRLRLGDDPHTPIGERA